MNIDSFEDLLRAARQQSEPQRLLFVFAGAELPDDASAEQRAAFAQGRGGALAPLMCADKAPDELGSFQTLVDESEQFGPPWAIVFVAAMSGQGGVPPTSTQAEAPLQKMVDAIKVGQIGAYLPFTREGLPVDLH
jgi:hypothetical protein